MFGKASVPGRYASPVSLHTHTRGWWLADTFFSASFIHRRIFAGVCLQVETKGDEDQACLVSDPGAVAFSTNK